MDKNGTIQPLQPPKKILYANTTLCKYVYSTKNNLRCSCPLKVWKFTTDSFCAQCCHNNNHNNNKLPQKTLFSPGVKVTVGILNIKTHFICSETFLQLSQQHYFLECIWQVADMLTQRVSVKCSQTIYLFFAEIYDVAVQYSCKSMN